jgi:transposase
VWLRAALGLRAAQIATARGWQVGSVRPVHSDYLRQGEAVLQSNPGGGRPRQNLTREQEQELLAPFLEQAAAGGVLVVAPVQAAYEAAVGRPVHHSEHLWDEVRAKWFANQVFHSMSAVEEQLLTALKTWEEDSSRVAS